MASDGEGGSPDLKIVQWETLHTIAQRVIERQVDHFHAIEEKVWRHAAILGVVLGAFTLSIPKALEVYQQAGGAAGWIFSASYITTLLVSIAGLFCFVMAMRYEELRSASIQEDFVDDLGSREYAKSLESLTRGLVAGYYNNKEGPFKSKTRWARRGWWALPVVLGLSTVALFSLVMIHLLPGAGGTNV